MSIQAKDETIRIRIESDKKAALTRMYEEKGTTISNAVRDFLDKELESKANILDRFDAIMSSADAALDAYGAPEITTEDIVEYVNKIRLNRSEIQ